MKHTHFKLNLLFCHVIIPIAFGGIIYLLFRDKSLMMFRWANAIGASGFIDYVRICFASVPTNYCKWLFLSLPDGLWVYSFTSFMLIVWGLKFSRHSMFWISIGPLLALCGEIGQAFGVVRGTFDPTDLLLCLICSILPVVILITSKPRKILFK